MSNVYFFIGASSDLGICCIRRLDDIAEKGTVVVAHYNNHDTKLRELQNELRNITLYYIQADLSQSDEVKRLIDEMRKQEYVPDHIIHLAASPFSYMKIKQWDEEAVKREMQIQFFSFTEIMKEFLPQMAKKCFGRVVVALSAYTLGKPPKFMSSYLAVKGALYGYLKAASAEYGEKGICINAVSPNMMETKFLCQVNEKIIEMTAQESMMKRNIRVEETASGILYLLSKEASYINGVNLNLTGGDYM